jgi:hypothetical protein
LSGDPPNNQLLGLFVHCVLAFKFAELFDFKTTGSILFLLGCRIVPALALGAFKCYNFTHCNFLLL